MVERITAYWDLYDKLTGQLLEANRVIKAKSWPAIGEMVIGVPGKPNSIVKDVQLKGMKNNLPLYDVFI